MKRIKKLINNILNQMMYIWNKNATSIIIPNQSISSELRELNQIILRSLKKTDINDHLISLFIESLSVDTKLVVELGVRKGESTFVLERIAKLKNSKLISVDIEDCSYVSSYKNRIFIKRDDLEFAKEFEKWCRTNNIEPIIDILFIDTSHVYDHTVREIESWFPFLSNKSKVFFHDTNLKEEYYRNDRSIGFGWDNKRGVIKAIETYFNKIFNENIKFVDICDGWLIKHYPNCNGFTILEKINI